MKIGHRCSKDNILHTFVAFITVQLNGNANEQLLIIQVSHVMYVDSDCMLFLITMLVHATLHLHIRCVSLFLMEVYSLLYISPVFLTNRIKPLPL